MSRDAQLNYQAFVEALSAFDSIGLTAPAGADGDSVGTQCAMRELLLQIYPQKKIRIINEEACPRKYRFMPEAKNFEVSANLLAKKDFPEVMICVDGGAGRIGDDTTALWKQAKQLGQIDHHAIGSTAEYHFRLYNPDAASTTEIVFKFVEALKLKLTPSIAQAIYLGFIFDTGLFKHSNTRPEILQMAAELLKTGFNFTETAEKGMLIRSPGSWQMLRSVLNTAHFENDGRYVWGALRQAEFNQAGGDADDREGIIDNLFLTESCEIAAFYFEKSPKEWKISFRSRGHNVAALAQSLSPGGGGHKLAAGCTLFGSEREVLETCHQAVKRTLNDTRT